MTTAFYWVSAEWWRESARPLTDQELLIALEEAPAQSSASEFLQARHKWTTLSRRAWRQAGLESCLRELNGGERLPQESDRGLVVQIDSVRARAMQRDAEAVARALAGRTRWSASRWRELFETPLVGAGYGAAGFDFPPPTARRIEEATRQWEERHGPLALYPHQPEILLAEVGTAGRVAAARIASRQRDQGLEDTQDIDAEVQMYLESGGGELAAPLDVGGWDAWLAEKLAEARKRGDFAVDVGLRRGRVTKDVVPVSAIGFLWLRAGDLWNLAAGVRLCRECGEALGAAVGTRVRLCSECASKATQMARLRGGDRRRKFKARKSEGGSSNVRVD